MSDIPEDAVEAVAETHRGTLLSAQGSISIRCSCDWNGTLDHWGDHLLAAYQKWMRSTGHIPDAARRVIDAARALMPGAEPKNHWLWTELDDSLHALNAANRVRPLHSAPSAHSEENK